MSFNRTSENLANRSYRLKTVEGGRYERPRSLRSLRQLEALR